MFLEQSQAQITYQCTAHTEAQALHYLYHFRCSHYEIATVTITIGNIVVCPNASIPSRFLGLGY